ncbi:hypothetical protein A3740_03600 [Oleiphilus sp. HI0068]|nr:hypothetical protein A3740_03600 [Oleiphilus sp. HI0068]
MSTYFSSIKDEIHTLGKLIAGCIYAKTVLFVENCYSDMTPLQDEELSEISGQAFVTLDQETVLGKEMTRVNIGMELKTQLNVEELKLGEYPRWENGEACFECDGTEPGLEKQGADLWVKNMSFGAIAETSGRKMDGRYYRAGEIIPFEFYDPYIEIAKEDDELVGMRIGFHQARGIFSGDILSFTGQLPVQIKDNAYALIDAPNRPWWFALAGALLPFTPVEGQAHPITAPNVVDGEVDYESGGQPDPVRATHIGLPSGSNFTLGPIPFIGDIDFATTDCNLHGVPSCFPMTQFKSMEVGEKQKNGTFLPTGGFFLSMQKKAMEWIEPVSQQRVSTPSGVFFSVPVGSVEFNLEQSFHGTPRRRVEYIDRGVGLF